MRFLDDLVTILAATAVLLVLIAAAPASPLRIVLGLPFVLFFPGYALVAALYPRRDDLDGIERVALSLGLSLAVVPLVGLVLNYTPWGIRLTPILVGPTMFIVVCSLAAMRARHRLPAAERFPADARPVLAAVRRLPWPAIALGTVLIGGLLVVGFRTGFLGRSRVGEAFTEFYVLGPSGKAVGYPRRLFVGEKGTVILGVVNQEGRPASYTVRVRAGAEVLSTLGPIDLPAGQKWEQPVSFALERPGERVKVEFLLYMRGADPSPYRRLHLWVEVRTS